VVRVRVVVLDCLFEFDFQAAEFRQFIQHRLGPIHDCVIFVFDARENGGVTRELVNEPICGGSYAW